MKKNIEDVEEIEDEKDIEDRTLIEQFKNGNTRAFEILFEKYSDFVTRYIYRFIRDIDISEEIMQEVFIVVFEKPQKYNGKSKVRNYIISITKNKILTYLRNKKIREEILKYYAKELYDGDKVSMSALNKLEQKEETEEVSEILNKMNPTYSLAIKLIDYCEFSYKQAAKLMNKNLPQMKSIIHRARKNLEKEMKRKFPDTVDKYSIGKNNIVQIILAVIIGVSMLTGLVYATIKLTGYFSNKKGTFTLKEKDEVIDESIVEITRERAKEIIDL